MRCLVAFVILLFLPLCAFATDYQALQTVSVRVDVGGGHGSGVLVTRQIGDVTRTYVWTAGHVAEVLRKEDGTFREATIYQEVRENGRFKAKVETLAKVISYSDPENGDDLALLEIEKDNFAPLSVSATFDLTDNILPIGTRLVHVGSTLGLYNSVSLGIVSQTDRDLLKIGKMFDQTSVAAYPGSSGGGVYTTDEKCIGLLVRGAGAGLNFVVPTRRMLPWAKRMQVEWAMNPAVKVPTHVTRIETPLDDGTGAPKVINSDPCVVGPTPAPPRASRIYPMFPAMFPAILSAVEIILTAA
jgi:S1-C subfamily serine protease